MTAPEQATLDAADRLRRAQGHELGCAFRGCDCGAVGKLRVALEDFDRDLQKPWEDA